MTYVGAVPTTGDFKVLDSITTSSATTFNLRQGGVAVYPQSANHCLVVLNGVLQTAGSSFNIVNDTIVFASSLSSSDVINQILVLGNVNDIGVPSDDTVSTAKIQADAINATKIADDSISDEHLDITAITGQTAITSLADTDKFLVSDASDSGNLKYVENQYLGGGSLNFITEVSSSSNHNGIVIDNCFTSTYENYLIIGDISVTNSGDTIRARMKSSSATLDGSQYTYRFQRYEADSNTQGNDTRATGDTYFQLTEGLNDNSARVSYTFKMYIFDPVSSSKRMGLRQESIAVNNSAVLQSIDGAGQYKDQTSIVGIAFYPSANNFSNSTIRIYGISNS